MRATPRHRPDVAPPRDRQPALRRRCTTDRLNFGSAPNIHNLPLTRNRRPATRRSSSTARTTRVLPPTAPQPRRTQDVAHRLL